MDFTFCKSCKNENINSIECVDCKIDPSNGIPTQFGMSSIPAKPQVYVKQEPYVDDKGIWVPHQEYVPEGCVSHYKLLMTKETFVEAYSRWIKGEER